MKENMKTIEKLENQKTLKDGLKLGLKGNSTHALGEFESLRDIFSQDEWYKVIQKGDLKKIEELIPFCGSSDLDQGLHNATNRGYIEAVKLICSHLKNKKSISVSLITSISTQPEIALFLAIKMPKNQPENWRRCMEQAASAGELEICKELLKTKPVKDNDFDCLKISCGHGRVKTVDFFLEFYLKKNLKIDEELLSHAIFGGKSEILQTLLSHFEGDKLNSHVLELAVGYNQSEMVSMLIPYSDIDEVGNHVFKKPMVVIREFQALDRFICESIKLGKIQMYEKMVKRFGVEHFIESQRLMLDLALATHKPSLITPKTRL